MSMMSEFKEFALKGNVMDLAIGVIIGGAFGKITTSLVEDIMMPIFSAIMGGKLDFTNMFIVLGDVPAGTLMTYDALKKAGVPVFAYGSFITILINFTLHTTKNQHQPIFMGLGVKKLTNCRNTALSLFNNTKRKPSINKSKPNANKLA